MSKGTIKALRSGSYGFIKPEEGEDLFFHSSNLEGVEFNSLSEGQEVEFEKGQGRDGRPAAVKVKLAGTGASDAGGDDQGESDQSEGDQGEGDQSEGDQGEGDQDEGDQGEDEDKI